MVVVVAVKVRDPGRATKLSNVRWCLWPETMHWDWIAGYHAVSFLIYMPISSHLRLWHGILWYLHCMWSKLLYLFVMRVWWSLVCNLRSYPPKFGSAVAELALKLRRQTVVAAPDELPNDVEADNILREFFATPLGDTWEEAGGCICFARVAYVHGYITLACMGL